MNSPRTPRIAVGTATTGARAADDGHRVDADARARARSSPSSSSSSSSHAPSWVIASRPGMAHRSAPLANVASAAATIAMPSRENMFHVEKHANDVLHNAPRRRGRTHTDVEIAAASMVLGRSAPAPAAACARAPTSTRVMDGAVVRIDAESLATDAGRCSTSEALRASGALGARGLLKNASLTEDTRWKTKDRILAGGTGGAAQLREARRAALGLCGGKRDADEDAPVVVPVEDLTFVDGWAGCDSARRAPSPVPAIVMTIAERARGSAVEVATIGRKRKKAHRSTSRVASNAGCLSFDVDKE